MKAYKTKRAREQLPIHGQQPWQSNASRQYWKSRTNALSSSTDYPPQMDHYREVTNTRCSCDTCSLLNAQEMERYYSTHGQPPLYLTSWPVAMQPQPYKQGFQPVQVQAQYQEIRQPTHSRGIPLTFTPQPHPLPTAPHQILHPAGYLEPCTYPPTSEIHSTPVNLPTQPQGPALNSPDFVPTTPQKIPHPAGHPEAGTCPSDIHETSPPSVLKASPTLFSDGSVNRAPFRPGGVAYDYRDLPKIVAVHSLLSSPVYVREQLEAAALLPMGSQVPNVYEEEPYNRNSDGSLPKPSHKVCLENLYPTIEPRTDILAGAENTCGPSGEKAEKINDLQDNCKDQSNMTLVKCEPVSPKFQSHESPKHNMPQHHNEGLADINFDQEKALQPKDDIDREMKMKTLFKRINAWQVDFNQETDNLKKWKVLNLILEGRAELEKLRLKRDLADEPNPEELSTSGVKGKSDDKEVVDSNASNKDTIAVENTSTVITNNDITAAAASDVSSRSEYATSQNMKLEEKGISPKSTMEIHSDDVKQPSVTMETRSNMRMSSTKTTVEAERDMRMSLPKPTMETESDEVTSPQITVETDRDMRKSLPKPTMETESEEVTSPQITVETDRDMRKSLPKPTMETESDEVTSPQITVETDRDMRKSLPKPTMETESEEVTSPQTTMETEITMDPNIGEDKMKTDICNDAPGTDAVCANMISSPFHVESTASSLIKTNTGVVYGTNASTTPSMSKDVTMTTLNTTTMTTDDDAMATIDSDPPSCNNSRNSSLSPDDFANTDFSISPEASVLLTMASPGHTNPTNVDKNTLLQPSIVFNVFDKVKSLYDRRKTFGDDTVLNEPEADEENCVEGVEIRNNDSPGKDVVNRILDENQIHEEPISSMKSEELPNIIKDPLATTEIKGKKKAGHSIESESDYDDVWTMELDENSQKAVFRRRWKRTGGPFDRKRSALESQTTDGKNEGKELMHGDEWFSISNACSPPSKRRALLKLRIIENEDQNDDDDGEQIINEAFKIFSGQLKRSIHSGQEPSPLLCSTDKSKPTEDLLASDLETADSPANETSLYHQDGGVEELEASSEDDFEESIFILERSLQLRESKIQRLNEKKEQLLDELKRIKASTPISETRDL